MHGTHTQQRHFGNDRRTTRTYNADMEVFDEESIYTDQRFEQDLRFGGDLWEETLRDLRKRPRTPALSLTQVAGPPL